MDGYRSSFKVAKAGWRKVVHASKERSRASDGAIFRRLVEV